MAAKSGGVVDWNAIIKPILSVSHGSFNKTDIIELVKAIVQSEHELFSHDDEYEAFYSCFAALVADYLGSCANTFNKSQVPLVWQACQILLTYLMSKLTQQNSQSNDNISPLILTTKQILLPIRALCIGQSLLAKSEEVALVAIMKNSKLPQNVKSSLEKGSGEKDSSVQSGKEAKKVRNDLSTCILEQLTMPLQDFGTINDSTYDNANKANFEAQSNEQGNEIKMMFIANNISILQSMGAGDTLLCMCSNLPNLSRYAKKYQTYLNKKVFCLPANQSDAHIIRHSLHSVVNDINILHNVVSLPILEPLTSAKLEKLSLLTMSCLYYSVANAIASSIVSVTNATSPKCSSNTNVNQQNNQNAKSFEEEYDTLAINVVERSLEIFNLVSNVIKHSTRAGGHILQNHLLLGVWLLNNGLQTQISLSNVEKKEDKGKSPSKSTSSNTRINLMKVQQGFGVLSVALASHALTLMTALLEDVSVEAGIEQTTPPEQAPLNILATSTALERVATLFQTTSLNHLLFYLATISYRKACSLKRVIKHTYDGETTSQSETSTTYYEDIYSLSESSTDHEEDSEPILGLWFEETLDSSDAPPNTVAKETTEESAADRSATVVPDNREPNGYISLATQIFQFMNLHLIGSKSAYVRNYIVNGLVEQQMGILSTIIKDLDHEGARAESGTIPSFYGPAIVAMYTEFSQALSRFTHNLLARNNLSETLQNTLLHHLGVSPWSNENASPSSWPLEVYPRTLSALAQILLSKPQSEKEAACISIWQRLITTLVENVCNPPASFETEYDDLNVEHAQFVIFLFHSLNLMQKKSVLLVTAGGVVRCSEITKSTMKESQTMHLSRILLLLEYMMKHLYDAPSSLLEQVQWNLFSATSLISDAKEGNKPNSRIYTPWKEVEDFYRKYGLHDEIILRPRFYNLTVHDFNNQDTPKLDGLACNFILGTADKLKYPLLIDALIDILNILNQLSIPRKRAPDGRNKLNATFMCGIQYTFSISWRLLLILPPSTPYMDKLALGEEIPAGPLLLHSLIWGPRAAYKTFTGWMKDCLVKQGMYTQYAENLLKTVSTTVNNLKYNVTLAKNCITTLKPPINSKDAIVPLATMPKLISVTILSAVIGQLHVLMDETIWKSGNGSDIIESPNKAPPTPDSAVTNNVNKLIMEILPPLVSLTEALLACCKSNVLYEIEATCVGKKYSMRDFHLLNEVISMSSSLSLIADASLINLTFSTVNTFLTRFRVMDVAHVPWNTYANDIVPAESYVLATIENHVNMIPMYGSFSINPSLKNLLFTIVTFLMEYVNTTTCPEESEIRTKVIDLLISLTMDARFEYLSEMAQKPLNILVGDRDQEARQLRDHLNILTRTYNVIIGYTNNADEPLMIQFDIMILKHCIKYWEKLLEKPVGCKALHEFFTSDSNRTLASILLSVASPHASPEFSKHVLHFFNKLFTTAEKDNDESLDRLCRSVANLPNVDREKLQTWLAHVILGSANLSSSTCSANITELYISAPAEISAPETSSPAASEETQKPEVPNDVVNNDQASNQWQALLTTSETTAPNNLPSISTSSSEEQQTMQQNNQLLRSLTNYIVKENDNSADGKSVVMLQALIPIAYRKLSSAAEGVSFTDLMQVMFTLADSGSDKGHTILFQAAIEWIDICKKKLLGEDPENLDSKSSSYIEAGCCVLNYVADIVNAVCPQNQFNERERALSPPWEGAQPVNDVTDSDWIDEIAHDEEESGAEDSDEDSLCNKLCTFTITQKEFMNQHWYHCHTCNMVDGVGVCSICAKVCHRGHDVTYAKYGNFFCDCGAKEDASCQALVKRSPQNSEQPQNSSTYNTSSSSENMMLPSSLRRRAASPVHYSEKYDKSGKDKQKQLALAKQLEGSKDWVLSKLWDSGLVSSLVELIRTLIPAVVASCNKFSPVGCHARAQAALSQLHYLKKKFEHTDQLMVHLPTLGSQEGAFENVRMNYSGDQGQTIRQLLSAHMIRRVAMCCLSSPHGKRQHLAVSHEKGKITVLQLSALLKQADSSKRKLTLTRLASAPIPFTVLSMTGNQWNEDFLAVCGLKDCHVLTFNSSGTVSDHLVLHPQLETGNFIIKAIWLPGSQTQLALVTADFVKIYDLSKDALSPQYYFLVPTGKIRDCTFIYTESGEFHLLLMSSAGYIYNQVMDEDSQAKHGPFYVTHTLDVFHPDIKDNGQVCGGGVSIYYSHALQLLFFSYTNGKSFVAPLKYVDDIDLVNLIQISSNKLNGGNSSGGGNKSNSNQPQPLCQWSEVPNHPGLICSVLQISNNPVILMIKPETISIQEIKVVPAKAKIMDMVAIRHPSSNAEHRTTLILLCEDGSLRIYMAAMGQTGYWMSSSVQPIGPNTSLKQTKKKKTMKTGKMNSGSVNFPIDFFEYCQAMNDHEFGGNDLLQVYNVTQIKNRLNTTGMYVVSTKSMGFNIEVTNNDTSSVITGIRVQLGSQDIQRAPMYVEVFGRSVRTILTRSRWFDIPLTREESLQADKKLTITFGPSQDPEGVIMVDSIKIYGKTKDAFGWPEESEDIPSTQGVPTQATTGVSSVTDNTENPTVSPTPLPAVDKMVSSVLDVLEYSFTLSNDDSKSELKQSAIEVASKLLTLPTPPPVQMHTTALLSALHVSKPQYHAHKDQVLLSHVMDVLKLMRETEDPNDIDAENFYRLVLIVRGIAVTRPHNLHKFAEQNYTRPYDASIIPVYEHERLAYQIQYQNNFETPHLMLQLMEVMWLLHCAYPKNLALAPVVVPGLTHTDAVVHAIIEIIHAFTICDMNGFAPIAAKLYLQLLLCCDTAISFNAKQAIIKVLRPRYKRRRVHIPSPPHFNISSDVDKSPVSQPQPQQPPPPPPPAVASVENEADENFDVDNVVSMVLLGAEAAAAAAGNQGDGGAAANNFLQLLDMPQAEDDEAMVELAIALSLQEHEDGPGANVGAPLPALIPGLEGLQNFGGQALQSLQALAAQVQVQQAAQVQEAGHYSDTTASAAGSDDEGSTAATDGSTLRTSPAEQGGSGGSKGSESGSSESGGSAVDSIMGEHNVSGRSSAYGDAQNDGVLNTSGQSNQQSRSETGLVNIPSVSSVQDGSNEQGAGNEPENDFVGEVTANLHDVRLVILDKLTEFLPNLVSVPGVQVIPFMQVLLMLTSDLDGSDERDRTCFEKLLNYFVKELNLENPVVTDVCQRSSKRETHLVIMRLLSVLMSRSKYNPKSQAETSNFISQTTASVLNKSGVINYCLCLLKALIEYWKTVNTDDTGTVIGGQLLKEHLSTSPPDMSPFFLRLYVKGHANDVFEPYPQLLTEMALRLPYQVHKHAESNSASPAFDQKSWYYYLCEYMMTYQTPFVRRQVRKLLLFICGNKEKYRQLRDLHALVSHVKAVQQCCSNGGYDPSEPMPLTINLPYDSLVELIEHLKCCVEIATSRTGNWQRFCIKHSTVLSYLFTISTLLDEGVSPTVLQLLQCAICSSSKSKDVKSKVRIANTKKSSTSPKEIKSALNNKERRDREKSEDSDTDAKFEETQSVNLVEQIQKQVSPQLLVKFIQTFLLETNNTNIRWQAHSLILAIYKNSNPTDQESILDHLWKLWPQLPIYGRKAAQFVDIIGYFSLRTPQNGNKMNSYMEQAVAVLCAQNQLLSRHPNANLYSNLAQFVELDGYYLESEPCLVCNNPEVPMITIKLSSIKVDSKFTTTTQIIKLVGSHTISRITLRIGDLKRTKMVRSINVYYNNRTVQAVVELKNKPAMWHKAKKIGLIQGQTEVKMEFPLPIVACNLMIEYSDFYENIQASSETLQCPRCSASVPANPGVCANCGENVYQCHKCRAINYDEKDPFLCHACGFCKYAKFDYTLTGRPCCAVDPIESDEDRKKTIVTINTLLDKADRVYKTLISNKPNLEMLLVKISDHRLDRFLDEATAPQSANSGTSTQVNRAIQLLAQRYCGECKTSFEELSKIIQRVLACRRELVAYDRNQRGQSQGQQRSMSLTGSEQTLSVEQKSGSTPVVGRCYGCASSATEYCLTLLRALATNTAAREVLCKQGLIQELIEHNLRRGTVLIQEEVRQLLCLVTRDNAQSTKELCSLLTNRVTMTLRGRVVTSDLSTAVRHEMALLGALIQKEDSCWEQKLRCVMQLFLMACKDSKSPVVMESIILPCLKILQCLLKPEQPISKKNKDKTIDSLATVQPPEGVSIDLAKWLNGEPKHTYNEWIQRMPNKKIETKENKPLKKEEARVLYLSEKYGQRWYYRCLRLRGVQPLRLANGSWLKEVIFNPSSRLARQVVCNMVENLCQGTERKKEVLLLLTSYLDELCTAGESSAEYLTLFQNLIRQGPWKQFLAVRGVLNTLADLLSREIAELHRLEETTLTSDLAQGYSLKMLTELLATFLDQENIKQHYKGRLVGAVLNGYLSLRRLVVQRTRLIDDTQEKLLELLEEMTTGTEEETKAFMAVCVETAKKYSPLDTRTPVFIFERLCSIIYPEENDVGEFFLTLEKDPQQEDFLQGRMLGNPYSSLEPGLGPLMRDVKNKICQDCELVALLEDDNGMELLVNNKIISLDLPVKEVYKKVWVMEGGECDAMRVVYRMRGLLGDATEEFVETLNASSEQEVNNEEVYKMANVLADCGGLQVMIERLAAIQDVNRAKPLLQVLLKLFRLSVKVKKNQEVLSRPELGAVTALLDVLQRCLAADVDNSQSKVTEQLLDIMETILGNAAAQPLNKFEEFSRTLGSPEHVKALLSCTQSSAVRQSVSVLQHLARVLAALTYGNKEKMTLLCDYFKPVLNFYKFDFEHTPEDEQKMELFCVLTQGIERNAIGNTLKDHMMEMGIVKDAFEYITFHAPCVKPTLLRTDSDELKEFISKPALKYILRILTGLASDHEPIQLAASQFTISIIHRLEQVSSNEHVGSLAENLLEALCTNKQVAEMIEEARQHTRSEKKRMAMAMRERQLGALGMRTNDKGQVTASGTILQQMEDLGDETGLVCVICREGYKFKPAMVLGIYTFTKRCNVEEFETKQRKTVGYTTVSHFNVVHIECHMSAVRLARSRDEWESAALQNANTKCNGLLPLWGPQVPESAFASCLARHNTYLQECTGHRDISYSSTVHDLKLLLLRFAQEKSFHDDTGGGGPQSNLHIIPYLIHMALYVINTTRCSSREEKILMSYMESSPNSTWLDNCYEAEGPLYHCTLAMLILSPARWSQYKLMHLRRLILMAQQRYVSPSSTSKTLSDTSVKDYSVYKSVLIFFGLVDCIYEHFFKKVNVTTDDQWPVALAEYIRHNDEMLLKASEKILAAYRDELLPCASFDEFCDVLGLLEEIADPPSFLADALQSLA
ncbi:protein purity of essence isoform X3 [Trichogramma pretiosum]|uniref:protein purity of essence isoform X3 n=1 Tax=Trichogramma pretiosum TaxID=7493 RepID=UPI0006C9BD7F|nr:protein purity of essence isoform X3 [Trichogramma pretiosum]